jgi:hypothetical protein
VHELRLFRQAEGEIFPGSGISRIDMPRRPLIVHSASYATTYDMSDNFYMKWQRKASVFTGQFTCCRLGHRRPGSADGAEGSLAVTCDKARIRPLVRGLWERKIAHLKTMPPFVRFGFLWRWVSHMDIMMSDYVEDVEEVTDGSLCSLQDVIDKYWIHEYHRATCAMWLVGLKKRMAAHPTTSEPEDSPAAGGGGATIGPRMAAWVDRWLEVTTDLERYQLAVATCYAVAEGNLRVLRLLHETHGADLTLGFSWGITLLDFAAGKGHVRIVRYLFEIGLGESVRDKPSFRERITAIDRACKAGFVDVLDILVERGATLTPRRLNRQTPAHGAAMMGHTHVLQRLHALGADLLGVCDASGRAPIDYASYFHHKDALDYLRSLTPSELSRRP